MRMTTPRRLVPLALLALSACGNTQQQERQSQHSWAAVDQALGRSGTTQPDGVRRYSFPRSDLNVELDGVKIKPAFALGSWLAFESAGDSTMVMGDVVLAQDEVTPVMAQLLKSGISVTAIHNHVLRSTPLVIYMHVEGHGDPTALARSLRSALASSKTPLQPAPPATQAPLGLDTAALDRILGAKGKPNGGVDQFTIPRAEKVTESGMPAPATMGTGTAINFQATGGGTAAVTGDFVLTANEVGPVMRALQSGGIEVTALHNHMLQDQPRLFFMHFWAVSDAARLATTLRSALDRMNVARA